LFGSKMPQDGCSLSASVEPRFASFRAKEQ
jgi:hypothetical protein